MSERTTIWVSTRLKDMLERLKGERTYDEYIMDLLKKQELLPLEEKKRIPSEYKIRKSLRFNPMTWAKLVEISMRENTRVEKIIEKALEAYIREQEGDSGNG